MKRYRVLVAMVAMGLLWWWWMAGAFPPVPEAEASQAPIPVVGAPLATPSAPPPLELVDPVLQEINAIDAETLCGARFGSVAAKAKGYLLQAQLKFAMRDIDAQLKQNARFVYSSDKHIPYGIAAPPYDHYTNGQLQAMSEVGDSFAMALLGVRLMQFESLANETVVAQRLADMERGFALLEKAMEAGERDVLFHYVQGKLLYRRLRQAESQDAQKKSMVEILALADLLVAHGSVPERVLYSVATESFVAELRSSQDAPTEAERADASAHLAERFPRLLTADPRQSPKQELALRRYTKITKALKEMMGRLIQQCPEKKNA